MLERARPKTRVQQRSTDKHFTWGVVDVILAILMLPFGIAVFIIERMVVAVTSAFNE
jgi:hypothetical protein